MGLIWWPLAQKALFIDGSICCEHPWKAIPDLYFHRDAEEVENAKQAYTEKVVTGEVFQLSDRPQLRLSLLNLRVQTHLKVATAPCAYSTVFLLQTGALSPQ